ncbi:MAG TPA: serine hydrolase [Candidatus Desulfaltia sp.]|nr:serine hydrolase [Candidatus Desulfaltia sp.]
MKPKKCSFAIALSLFNFVVLGLCSWCVDLNTLRKALEAEIAGSGAEVSLAFKDLQTGETLLIKEKDMVHAASTMKVPVLIEVFKQAEDGKFRLDDWIVIKNEFHSIVDGSPFSLNKEDDSDTDIYGLIGTSLTIRELAERMITSSSNLATNILIELVRPENVMSTLDLLGIRRMRVLRSVEDGKAFERDWNNQTDASDLLRVMEAIASGKAGSLSSCREMILILEKQKFRDGIPAGVPAGIPVANKTGSITGMEHDAAIVFPRGRKPYILVVLTRGAKSPEEGERLIARLSELIYGQVVPR